MTFSSIICAHCTSTLLISKITVISKNSSDDLIMNSRWLVLFSILFCATAQAVQFPTQLIEQFDDVKIVSFINESDINNSALWNPLETAPPLSISGAIDAVKKHSSEMATTPALFSITEIELRQIPHHKNLWHYLIKTKSDVNHTPKNAFYVALMDGTIIPAIAEPISYK